MQTNGTGTLAPAGAPANPIPMTSRGVTQTFTPEEIRDRLAALTQPFPPQLIEWRVTNTTRDRRGNRGQVVARDLASTNNSMPLPVSSITARNNGMSTSSVA